MDPDPASFTSDLSLPGIDISLDPGTILGGAVVLIALLLASALFSGAEVALFSLHASGRLADEEESRSVNRVQKLLRRPRELLVSILILNTFANVMAAIIAAVFTWAAASQYGWSKSITVAVEVIVVTFVILVVSEITPKLLASRDPVAFSRKVSFVLLPLHNMLLPASKLVTRLTTTLQHRFAPTRRQISTEELKTLAEIGEAHGTIKEDERDLIHSIVEFGDRTVREIMTSRLDIVAIPVTATLSEALDIIRAGNQSRLPLYIDHLDNILGSIHAKDLLPYLAADNAQERVDWTRIARKPMFVPAGKTLDDLLKDFQTRNTHIAIVVDEYGGTEGLVTLEDVLEEIVGEIRDEHDESEDEFVARLNDGRLQCDGRLDLDDLNTLLGLSLATGDFDFETLGGLVFHLSGAVPQVGDKFTYRNLDLEVAAIDKNRIESVIVRKLPEEADKSVQTADR